MRDFSCTPSQMVASFWGNRQLIIALTKREIVGRYRSSALGLLWSFFNPLFMLSVYTFVFSEVFQSRWGNSGGDSKTEFALILFAGLIIFNLFADCINRAPSLILANANYVKKVVFPLEILPEVALLSALFHAGISLGVWFLAYIIFYGVPPLTALYLPLILIPLCFLTLGLSWILASLGVYVRDISQVIGIATTVLMFLSPIFYPVSALPQAYRHYLYLNPLTPLVEQARDVLYFGMAPNFIMLSIFWALTVMIAWVGYAWFQKTRKGFADVL